MIHVAVLIRPYVELVLAGRKTVECRLTRQARDPFDAIEPGERIYFKESAGPYRATALAEHVLCEGDLTPRRVGELRRDYNHLILGEADFWRRKRASRYATLIWLRDVEPTGTGPAIRPLQGVAWLRLAEEPAWRRANQPARSFTIQITPGNLRHHTLYATKAIGRFPESCLGGPTRAEAARPLTLILRDGPTVHTDIVGARKLFRTRVWGAWFSKHGARPGDHVLFTPAGEDTFYVGLTRDGAPE